METLEVKHLAPYLPYDLKVVHGVVRKKITAISLCSPVVTCTTYLGSGRKHIVNFIEIKPILRPLSDLTKEDCCIQNNPSILYDYLKKIDGVSGRLEYVGKINYAECFKYFNQEIAILALPYHIIEELIKNHFDVFGLIEKGLAVDINTLKA